MTTDELLHISYLLRQSLREQLSEEERAELLAWCVENPANQRLYDRCHDEDALVQSLSNPAPVDPQVIWNQISVNVSFRREPILYRLRPFRNIAAAIFLLLFTGATWYMVRSRNKPNSTPTNFPIVIKSDVVPGGSKALLTLADGSSLPLDSAHNGQLALQGKVRVLNQDGNLSYAANGQDGKMVLNTMTTPRGGQYRLVLPDGSRVWLNAASSLRYPTAFTGKTREVELAGEAYFEIAKDKNKPFTVKTTNTAIEVLGTSFNVNAYPDEPDQRTTLVDGNVKVSNKENKSAFLQPGQQAVTGQLPEGLMILNNTDLEATLAWKNGYFLYKKAHIQTIMRQIARWYDVDIEYTSPVDDLFYTKIPRNATVSAVFEALQAAGGVHFTFEGRKIIVSR